MPLHVSTAGAGINLNLFLRNYASHGNLVFTVQTPPKKVPRNFRLDSKIEAELRRRSKLTGIPETRLLEDALKRFFDKTMQQQLAEMAKNLGNGKGSTENPNQPLTSYTSNALTAAA